jgi:protein-S-isoprenylcysteine O-methyltransferase Ste14
MSNGPPLKRFEIIVGYTRRHVADLVLFSVTAIEMSLLFVLAPTFRVADWIYVCSNLLVLVIALTRRPAQVQDRSIAAAAAVFVSYTYSYAQVAILRWSPGIEIWPGGGLIMVILGACLSLASLLSLRRFFGVRPALRGLATQGTYRLVRHPLYLAYVISDIGYNLQECNFGTWVLVAAGWLSLMYRIRAEEHILSGDATWADYITRVRYRLLPGVW